MWIWFLMPTIGIAVAFTHLAGAAAQYGSPYGYQEQYSQSYADQFSDQQIENWLAKYKVYGVRPSREAYLAVRRYGVHARLLINNFGEDGLASLKVISGTSAISLRNLIPELKQLKQVSALLRLIASHEEPDRIVQLLVAYRSELVDSPFVEVLLQKPDAVLALGPRAQMPEIIALYDDPVAVERSGTSRSSILDEMPNLSGIAAGLSKEQVELILYGILLLAIGIAIVIQARQKLRHKRTNGRTVAQPAARLTYQPSRPTPAFMRNHRN